MVIKRLDHVNFITHNPEETIKFYTQVVGLSLGSRLSIDTSTPLHFHIPGHEAAILHVGHAASDNIQLNYERLAELSSQQAG